jgi:hypothetical protein
VSIRACRADLSAIVLGPTDEGRRPCGGGSIRGLILALLPTICVHLRFVFDSNTKPPIGDVTNVEGNRKYADYNAILMDNVGHFIQLERPKEFNENLSKCLAELLK